MEEKESDISNKGKERLPKLDCLYSRKGINNLWNVANYERKCWINAGDTKYPDWYDQKKRLKDHYWYKSLPS